MINPIIISSNKKVKDEAAKINLLFQNGLLRFHLRKKTWFKNEVAELLEKIDKAFYSKIILHQHLDLVFKYDLGGFHFNKSHPFNNIDAEKLTAKNKSKSISSHSICDLGEYEYLLDYQFISPVFPSISKPEVKQTINHEVLKKYLNKKPNCKIFALGGITFQNHKKAMDLGVDSVALLGFIWQKEGLFLEHFLKFM